MSRERAALVPVLKWINGTDSYIIEQVKCAIKILLVFNWPAKFILMRINRVTLSIMGV
jgi:hypothetical protein